MEVFKNEGNVSQDANFRAHLDDNWDSGNREFDKVEGQLEIALDDIQFLKNEIPDWKKELGNLKQQHSRDIDALNKVIADQDKRIAKLEKAVFEAQYINDTDDVADYDKSVISQDINETNAIDDDNGLIIEEDKHKSLPSEVND